MRRTAAHLSHCARRRQLMTRRSVPNTPLRLLSSTKYFSSTNLLSSKLDYESETCNVPPHIGEKVLSDKPKLYQIPRHPLYTIKQRIEDYFPQFEVEDSLSPIVSSTANFDSLLIPPDHVSRSKSDTYYVDYPNICLRTHTSAHQLFLLKKGQQQFLCTGDVYRRDDIDKSHYPIFHQMEGVKVFDGQNVTQDEVLMDLKHNLEGLAKHLFGPVECRWVDEYFPFTDPSLELEIWYQDDWLEVLGCGVMQASILEAAGHDTNETKAWAFGLGLERLAMVLFDIPDIRLFWSQDERFWKQFPEDGRIVKFQPYSKHPPCHKDDSFWILEDSFHVHELLDRTRQVAGDLVETVDLVDQFNHPKTNKESHCYRITYRSMDRSLTNAEVDELQEELRDKLQSELPIELR